MCTKIGTLPGPTKKQPSSELDDDELEEFYCTSCIIIVDGSGATCSELDIGAVLMQHCS